MLAVNRELVTLYWQIGRDILDRQEKAGWGAGVIGRLAKDLRLEFPDVKGFSPRNLGYMKALAQAWPDEAILQQLVAQLPWGHNCVLLDKVKEAAERLWYIHQAVEYGWSRNILGMHIETGLYRRQGHAQTNFVKTLPSPQSDLAQQLMKDPYNFDFLTLSKEAHERDVESGLLEHVRNFLVELGVGFAFVGSQVPLEVGGEDFRIDLLFYHLKLRMFRDHRLKNDSVQTGVRRQDELLPGRYGRSTPASGRQTVDRSHSLQNQEPDHCRIRLEEYRDAHGDL
jgi:predicted nuclease of restriction endonuclease-like (RecB) superfamily